MRKPLLALGALAITLAIWAGCRTSTCPAPDPIVASGTHLKPGPNDARIAHIAARLLEEYHYSQRPLDTELSKEFFDNYIDMLDPRHENFLQADLAEFNVYRTNLDKLTINPRGAADLTPAFAIYDRYAERIQQHDAYVNDLLKEGKFKFNSSDDKISLDRRKAPFPKDLAEAEALWAQRLRYEYLQEKLSREIVTTNDNFTVVKLPKDAAQDITSTLARHYRWNLHMTTNWDSDGVLQAYLNALANAYDPHSDYFSGPKAQDFSIGMNLSLFGIGAQLTEDDGYCTIRSLVPGGPAAKSKAINEKDRILAVAQGTNAPVDVVDMELEKVVQQIRGAKGTEVRLTISPADDRAARKVVTLVRDEIKLEDSEAKAKLLEMPDGQRIGIIDLPSFYATVNLGTGGQTTPKSTTADVAKLITKLKQEKVSGIIIDLRTNPGGSLEEAIRFTGLFIKDGPIVQARSPGGQVSKDYDPDPTQLYDGPLVVMVNRFSASASEIAAAALQDYGRALVVGDISTHGKGTVQNLNPLKQFMLGATNDPGTIKITIRKFYRVSGASTQLKGVEPDLVLPDVLNYSTQIGESSLGNPLPWDTIQPASYDKLNLVQPYLAQLKTNSDRRIATNQDFAYVKQDIAQFQKMQADKTAPINESEAIKERKRIFTQNKARDAERLARKPDGVKIYEITVKNADEPGLVEYKPGSDPTTTASTGDNEDHPQASGTSTGNSDRSGTNVTLQAENSGTNTVKSAKADKPTPPPFDPMLEETERILQDYIQLLAKNHALVAHD
ncbi:MAG TPA: carboxy terminal-processing peptidase [bacterium]|nr:carboxy terminal-processing peptidase [bacterium]